MSPFTVHAQASIDGTLQFHNRFSALLKDSTPDTAIGTNYIKFVGTSDHEDSCTVRVDEYRDKNGSNELVSYSFSIFRYNVGEKSGFNYAGNLDNKKDSQRDYDTTTGMELPLLVGADGKITRILTPAAASHAGVVGYAGISAWKVSQQGNKLIINQAAQKDYWGNRNLEITFSDDGASVLSVSIVSLATNGRYNCNSVALVKDAEMIAAKAAAKAKQQAEEAEKGKPVSCNSECSPCTHIYGPGTNNTNSKAQLFEISSRNFSGQQPAVIGRCDAKKLYEEYPGLKLNYNNTDAVCSSRGDCTHVKIGNVGNSELYCLQTTLVSDPKRPTFWECVVYDTKSHLRIKDYSSLKEALQHLNIKLD